ncbi:MAG: 1-acyl-sn-glycerol-3-phosphate acyltransferase [Rhodothermales bacterium]|jgi:1-acyl-sn-glycerol-3-phosphate acyltransferase
MLDFSDKPYVFVPPAPNRFFMWLLRQANRLRMLPGPRHRIPKVRVLRPEAVAAAQARAGTRILFMPNHPSHSDAEILSEAQRQIGVSSLYMAAYDVFLRSAFEGWCMQRAGAFSVDREGSDKPSMKAAIEAMATGDFAMSIFPEGNVYLCNDCPTPFLDGAAFMALKAQQKLPEGETLAIVPVAIKLSYLDDVRPALRTRLADLPGAGQGADVVAALTAVGDTLLQDALELRGLPIPDAPTIRERLEAAAASVIGTLEAKMELTASKGCLIDRIRAVRRRIHQIRIDAESAAAFPDAESWADDAILALRILSYTGDYLQGQPSLDRVAESIEKLVEDYTGKRQAPVGRRQAFVSFGDPLFVADFANAGRSREIVQQLTAAAEASIAKELVAINAANPNPGGGPFSKH